MHDLLSEIHWKEHIFTLSQLSVSLLVLIVATFYYFDKKAGLAEANLQYESQTFSNDEAESFKLVLQENMRTHGELVTRGAVGTPRRLQWLETLRRTGDRLQIPGIEFTLEGTELIQQNMDPYWHPEVPIRATNMKILLQLSHEGDLYRLLEGLRADAQGLFSVERCGLRWMDSFSPEFALSRLRGECQLRWYTLADVTSAWLDTGS